MAHHKQALKRIKTNEKRRLRNKSYRSRMKTDIKNWRELIEDGEFKEARAAFPAIMQRIAKTASKGVMKRYTASRKISRLAKELDRAEAKAE